MGAYMTKNDYFDEYFAKCEKKLGERKFKKQKFKLIDIFQNNWEKYLKSKNPDDLVKYAISKAK